MNHKKIYNSFLLGLTALIWGAAFVAQSVGLDYVGPFTFLAVRTLLGGMVLIPVIFFLDKKKKKDIVKKENTIKEKKTLLLGGICCGFILTIASSLQQIGIVDTSVGKAGFITALYIVIVPILGIFLKKKVGIKIWISVALAMIGMYLLSITEGATIGKGDFLVFLSAVFFSIHIMVIDYFSPRVDGVKMSCIQFFVCGFLCSIPMFLWEQPKISSIIAGGVPILYAGILSCGVAYTLQIVAQKNVGPMVASLVLSMESVFAALCGWIILGETLSTREMLGCIFVFSAIILAQLPELRK